MERKSEKQNGRGVGVGGKTDGGEEKWIWSGLTCQVQYITEWELALYYLLQTRPDYLTSHVFILLWEELYPSISGSPPYSAGCVSSTLRLWCGHRSKWLPSKLLSIARVSNITLSYGSLRRSVLDRCWVSFLSVPMLTDRVIHSRRSI